ncbi:MAG: YdcF family protein [Chloroflexi bacterium]|nr:YdcF family protein [Chloroflexota bacterium]
MRCLAIHGTDPATLFVSIAASSSRNQLRRLLVVALVVVLLALAVWLPFAGSLLVGAEEPMPADALVVLAGNAPDRLPHAEDLRAAGFANLLIVSNERVHTHGLETTWLELYRAGLSAPELPRSAVIVLDEPPPESTIDEARRVADILARRGLHSALLVTDAFHSRRASWLFRAAFARRGLTVRSTPAPDALDLAHYWRHPLAARRVAEEWAKFLYYLVQGAYW